MSVAQRIIVRMGVDADVSALHFGELGLDTDTMTMRLGNDTPNPAKILTTQSTGYFDFSSTDTIKFNNIEFKDGGGIQGVDLGSLTDGIGLVVAMPGGQFRHTSIQSSDSSVIITRGDGQSGVIDLKVSSASIAGALGNINTQIITLTDAIEDIELFNNDVSTAIQSIYQLVGRPTGASDLGTFLGSIIPDGATVKTALQAVETALENLDAASFDLKISGNDEFQLGLSITDDDYVIFEGATPDLAGLLIGSDKQKLDYLTVTTAVNVNEIQVSEVTSTGESVTIVNSNGAEVDFPMATATGDAGAISSLDKKKLDNISANGSIDLDNLESRVSTLEFSTVSPVMYIVGDQLWVSTDTLTTFDIDLSLSNAFAITYQRPLNGYEFESYDAITVGGVEVVKAENVTKSYEGSLLIIKARDNQWYYIDHRGLSLLLADAVATDLTVNVGSNNAVKINKISYL